MDRRDRNRRKKARQLARNAERQKRRRPKRRHSYLTAAQRFAIIEPVMRRYFGPGAKPWAGPLFSAAETCPCCDKKPLKLSDAIGQYDAETLRGLFNCGEIGSAVEGAKWKSGPHPEPVIGVRVVEEPPCPEK